MKLKNKLLLVGLIFLITIVIFIWGFFFLKGNSLLKKDFGYYAVYDDIMGLRVGNPITISGFQVGQVINISLTQGNNPKVVVHFILEKDIKIPKNTVAQIYSTDLMGTKGIRLIFSDNSEFYNVGDTLLSAVETDIMSEVSKDFEPLKEKLSKIINNFDTLIFNLKNITDNQQINKSVEKLYNSLEHLSHIAFVLDTMLTSKHSRINYTLNQIRRLAQMLNKNNDTIALIIENLKKLSDTLASANAKQLIDNANKSLAQLNQLTNAINQQKGTLGKIIYDKQLYNQLLQISKDIDTLLIDINKNPKRYFKISLIHIGKTNNIQMTKSEQN